MSNSFLARFATIDAAQSEEIARRIEAGESVTAVARLLELTPIGLVAAMARLALGADDSEGLPLVHGQSAHPGLADRLTREATLDDLFPGSERADQLALAAGLLQVFDVWEASHTAAQESQDLNPEVSTAAVWHMIAHRREPDAGNARYWARRFNPRGAFDALPQLAAPLLRTDPTWASRLVDRQGAWNPSAMIDLCEQCRPGSLPATLARRLQRLEMLVLLGHCVAIGHPGRS